MPAIDVFDGHCDTVLKCCLEGGSFGCNPYHVDLDRGKAFGRYAQFFALFGQPEDFPGLTPRETFEREHNLFSREMKANASVITHCRTAEEAENAFKAGKMAAFLSVEGAELLDCSLERLEEAHALGVRAVNPTWNRANDLSGTNAENTDKGLTEQGRAFVRKAEALGVLVDVSHLSDPGFWDVADTLSSPFFASHSNSRSVFSHPRNLTDQQFTAIIEHDGVAGLNLFTEFVGEKLIWRPSRPIWITGWNWEARKTSPWAVIWMDAARWPATWPESRTMNDSTISCGCGATVSPFCRICSSII